MQQRFWVVSFHAAFMASILASRWTLGEVRLSEVMYHPPQDDQYQYIEVHNDGAGPADIGDWTFTVGIQFTFPHGTIIPAGAYFVVSKSKA